MIATLSFGSEFRGQTIPHRLGAFAVVRPDEGELGAALREHGGIELVVDVDDDDPGFLGFAARGHERLRVGGRNDNGVHLLRDHLLDEVDLPADVQLVLDAVGEEGVVLGVLLLVSLGAVLHGEEELVRQGFHDERDARLAGLLRRRRGRGGPRLGGPAAGKQQAGEGAEPECGETQSPRGRWVRVSGHAGRGWGGFAGEMAYFGAR